ncbi:Abi family protein [Bifidobacterium catenulatum]|uniref:Abi family protein n=1 Tax=Bifidobacterium catenulatum TaxID=1686 RepID=UPI003F9114D0
MAVENQVQRLNKRGLQTDTRTPWILEREGYYSVVNGYKDPFLDKEAGIRTHEDQYLPNTSFNELYALFVFDRNLRFLLFRMTTLSEAILKTICSYEFTKEHADEKNPYLNIANYAETGKAHDKAIRLIPKLEKIIFLNKDSNFTDGKEYLRHCLEKYEGEVPLWVLCNDLTIGQVYWFFQAQNSIVRGNISRSFTALYKDSHRHGEEITSIQLDKIYRRIKDFRNICAHDERLYCAHPHDRNITVFQLVKDLRLVTDKKRYLEFLQSLESLLVKLRKNIPNHFDYVCSEMGLQDLDVLQSWMQTSRQL